MNTLSTTLLVCLMALCHLANAQESGCTYELACNYNPAATIHADVCDFDSCVGCTYHDSNNYNPLATIDDGSCGDAFQLYYSPDLNVDGVVDMLDVLLFLGQFGVVCANLPDPCDIVTESTDQCNIVHACNYNPEATIDDGSCIFDDCGGCTYYYAPNYDDCAKFDDGSCYWYGANVCPADCNFDFKIDTVDLLCMLGHFGSTF